MGFGDEIMALGRAESRAAALGRPVSIRDKAGKPRTHELWQGNPAWSKDAPDFIVDAPGARPYLKGWGNQKQAGQYAIFADEHEARAGRVWLTAEESERAPPMPYAVISPLTKDNASANKQWGIKRWERVIDNFPIRVYQLGPIGTEIIKGATHFATPTMRHAAAVVARAALVLTNEGGMHHLAAAMDVDAVVVFGAFISPRITGYANHANFSIETPEGYCGRWEPCDHCEKAMAEITPDMVKEKAHELL